MPPGPPRHSRLRRRPHPPPPPLFPSLAKSWIRPSFRFFPAYTKFPAFWCACVFACVCQYFFMLLFCTAPMCPEGRGSVFFYVFILYSPGVPGRAWVSIFLCFYFVQPQCAGKGVGQYFFMFLFCTAPVCREGRGSVFFYVFILYSPGVPGRAWVSIFLCFCFVQPRCAGKGCTYKVIWRFVFRRNRGAAWLSSVDPVTWPHPLHLMASAPAPRRGRWKGISNF